MQDKIRRAVEENSSPGLPVGTKRGPKECLRNGCQVPHGPLSAGELKRGAVDNRLLAEVSKELCPVRQADLKPLLIRDGSGDRPNFLVPAEYGDQV
jgi:hypothetical protein